MFINNKVREASNKNNTLEMKVDIIKQIYAFLLSPEGRDYLAKAEKVRNVLEKKVEDFLTDPRVETHAQFLAMSRAVLTVISNINIGLQI